MAREAVVFGVKVVFSASLVTELNASVLGLTASLCVAVLVEVEGTMMEGSKESLCRRGNCADIHGKVREVEFGS